MSILDSYVPLPSISTIYSESKNQSSATIFLRSPITFDLTVGSIDSAETCPNSWNSVDISSPNLRISAGVFWSVVENLAIESTMCHDIDTTTFLQDSFFITSCIPSIIAGSLLFLKTTPFSVANFNSLSSHSETNDGTVDQFDEIYFLTPEETRDVISSISCDAIDMSSSPAHPIYLLILSSIDIDFSTDSPDTRSPIILPIASM